MKRYITLKFDGDQLNRLTALSLLMGKNIRAIIYQSTEELLKRHKLDLDKVILNMPTVKTDSKVLEYFTPAPPGHFISGKDIAIFLQAIGENTTSSKLGRLMPKLGFVPVVKRVNGKTTRGYLATSKG